MICHCVVFGLIFGMHDFLQVWILFLDIQVVFNKVKQWKYVLLWNVILSMFNVIDTIFCGYYNKSKGDNQVGGVQWIIHYFISV